jgi:hypothetical protein
MVEAVTPEQVFQILETVFADVLGFTKDDWKDIEDCANQMRAINLFGGDPLKCTIVGFVLWFELTGYSQDDRIPDTGMH